MARKESPDFERWKATYERKGCTEEQLVRLAALGKITKAELKNIMEGEINGKYIQK